MKVELKSKINGLVSPEPAKTIRVKRGEVFMATEAKAASLIRNKMAEKNEKKPAKKTPVKKTKAKSPVKENK